MATGEVVCRFSHSLPAALQAVDSAWLYSLDELHEVQPPALGSLTISDQEQGRSTARKGGPQTFDFGLKSSIFTGPRRGPYFLATGWPEE